MEQRRTYYDDLKDWNEVGDILRLFYGKLRLRNEAFSYKQMKTSFNLRQQQLQHGSWEDLPSQAGV